MGGGRGTGGEEGGEPLLLEVFPGLVPGTGRILKEGLPLVSREGGNVKRVCTLDIHPEALRFIGKDAISKSVQKYTHNTIKGDSF